MPRAPRIETNEGLYHVINRGNYRSFIFNDEGAKKSFEACLFEACERSGWRLHAYCVMSNHFHLCMSTPQGNLSEGMRWLQSTFAARFNRFRKETGHLFQGRFKSLLVEPGIHFCDLVDYIHLNPVRAKMVDEGSLSKYRWSSLHWFPKKKMRPKFLDACWMDCRDEIADTASGWRKYSLRLQMRIQDDPKKLEALERRMCRGWCIGGKDFKKENASQFLKKKETARLEKEGLKDLNESLWRGRLEEMLKLLGRAEDDAARFSKSADWKLAIATRMKEITSVSNAWLSAQLEMGVARGVSSNCSVFRNRKEKSEAYGKLRDFTFED